MQDLHPHLLMLLTPILHIKREPIFHGSHNILTTSPKVIAVQFCKVLRLTTATPITFCSRHRFCIIHLNFKSKLCSQTDSLFKPYSSQGIICNALSVFWYCKLSHLSHPIAGTIQIIYIEPQVEFTYILTEPTHQPRWLKSSQDSPTPKNQIL